MATIKQLKKKLKKRSPKAWAKAERQWDSKMIGDVADFITDIYKHINPKAQKAIKDFDWLYNGPEIEAELWKLLAKVRRITQREK